MTEVEDPDGKSFFIAAPGTAAADLRAAVLMTYVLNAGTGYGRGAPAGEAGDGTDFPPTAYCADEVRRIARRQRRNRWSYTAARTVLNRGGSVAATPNGILVGIAANRVHRQFCQRGGTAYGDLFLLNVGRTLDPAGLLRRILSSGHAWAYHRRRLIATPGRDLDRLLHHEERHARQWARLGPVQMSARYLAEEARVQLTGGFNRFEVDAGLRDGGYA